VQVGGVCTTDLILLLNVVHMLVVPLDESRMFHGLQVQLTYLISGVSTSELTRRRGGSGALELVRHVLVEHRSDFVLDGECFLVIRSIRCRGPHKQLLLQVGVTSELVHALLKWVT
jgi:hypothetical protein